MICPKCGFIDITIEIPKISRISIMLGKCPKCNSAVYATPTSKIAERSKKETVQKGEKREEILTDIFVKNEKGDFHKKREDFDDIDREVYDIDNNLLYFMEIK